MKDHTCTDECVPPTFRYQVRPGMELTRGDRVRFLSERLGVLLYEDAGWFVGTLGRDFVGEFYGPHPSDRLAGWYLVTVPQRAVEPANEGSAELIQELVRQNGRDARLFVPVHAEQIEPAS